MNEISLVFCQPSPQMRELTDEQFLSSIVWDSSARPSLISTARTGDVSAFFRKLRKQHPYSGKFARMVNRTSSGTFPERSLWSRSSFEETPRTTELVDIAVRFGLQQQKRTSKNAARRRKSKAADARTAGLISDRRSQRLADWLASAESTHPVTHFDLQLLLELLLQLGRELPENLFWRLWRVTLIAVAELSRHPDEPPSSAASDDQRLLIQGELPFAAGLLFADVAGSDELREFGRQHLFGQLEDRTDTDGTPQAEILENLSLWLAVLVRSAEWAATFDTELWDTELQARFRGLVRACTPLCRVNGRLALSNGALLDPVPLLASASRLAGWKKTPTSLSYLLKIGSGRLELTGAKPVGKRHQGAGKSIRPARQSDWARVAVLRSSWDLDADSLVVAHHLEKPMLELTVLGTTLLHGTWDIDVTVEGKTLDFAAHWTCTCWHSDEDADYLELQLTLEDDVQIERQLLLSRTDRFIMLADVVTGARDGRIDYKSRLPLVDGVSVKADVPTRQCRLRSKRLAARVFPLALPADRVLSIAGGLISDGGALELRQVSVGGLYAPLMIDWHPDRCRTNADWRSLTVSEQGRIVKTDAAAGHRLRIGRHQLLVYRSLKKPSVPRSVLGQHSSYETLIGHFDSAGDLTPILMVE